MNEIVVSVITVVYNAATTIEETILSVINFIDKRVEYIIIDGGSSDGTIDIIKKYNDKISFWISEPDKGIYDAMNKGVAYSKGSWIININSGDKLLNIPFDELNKAEIKKFDAMCGIVITEVSNPIYPVYNWTIKLFNTLPHQGLFYKKVSIYSKYDLTYNIFADFSYNIGMYQRNQTILLSNKIIAFHSLNGVSNSYKNSKELFKVVYAKGGFISLILSYSYFKLQGLVNKFPKKK